MRKKKGKNMNPKQCLYCNFYNRDPEIVKLHEKRLHGCYRDRIPRTPKIKKEEHRKPSKEDMVIKGKLLMPKENEYITIRYEWNADKNRYDMYTDATLYGDNLEIIFDNKKNMFRLNNIINLKKEYFKKKAKMHEDAF